MTYVLTKKAMARALVRGLMLTLSQALIALGLNRYLSNQELLIDLGSTALTFKPATSLLGGFVVAALVSISIFMLKDG